MGGISRPSPDAHSNARLHRCARRAIRRARMRAGPGGLAEGAACRSRRKERRHAHLRSAEDSSALTEPRLIATHQRTERRMRMLRKTLKWTLAIVGLALVAATIF